MFQYLGELGALVPLKAPARLRIDGARPGTLRTTLGGVRKAQTGQRVHRTWDVDLARLTRPEDAATLAGFVAGEFGTGPWVFVDAWAQVTNLCTPRGAALEVGALAGAVLGGVVDLGEGWAGRHLLTTTAVDLPHVKGAPQLVPAREGTPVTVSAWVDGGGTVTPVFRTAEGAVLPAGGPVSAAGGTGWERVTATATAPPGAASVQVRVSGAERVARPAVTWTPEPVAYHGGQGATDVVIVAHTQDVGRAEVDPGRQYAAVRYTIEEVG